MDLIDVTAASYISRCLARPRGAQRALAKGSD